MKIALVVHDVSKVRGHDRYVAEMIEHLWRAHEIDVFAHSMDRSFQGKGRFHRVPVVKEPNLAKILTFLLASTYLLREGSYDVVHCQGLCSLTYDVVTAHTCQAAHRQVKLASSFRPQGFTRPLYQRLMMRVISLLERRVYQSPRLKAVIAPSEKIKRELIAHYGVTPELIRVIYHGVNLTEFNPRNVSLYREDLRNRHGIPLSAFITLFVGEFERKGLGVVIKALSGVRDVVLLVVGPGLQGPYRRLAAELAMQDRILFVGESSEVAKYYAASDLLVCPGLYDPFGLVVLEAMAGGLPVILSREMGAAELITHKKDGILLANPESSEELAAYIELLKQDHDLRRDIGEEGRKKAESLTWERTASLTLNVYERV